jgi:hypothetical protein
MVPSKASFKEVKNIPPEPSNNAPRVSRVLNKVMGYNKI